MVQAGKAADHVIAGDTTTDFYNMINGIGMSGTNGIPMSRAGSLVGIGSVIVTNAHSVNGTVNIGAYIDNVLAFTTTHSVTATGTYVSSNTVARGTHTFSADSVIQLKSYGDGTYNGTIDVRQATVDVQFDT
jgi:hypothetical protein